MKMHLYCTPVLAPEPTLRGLNKVLAIERVSQADKHFVADGQGTFWSICVTAVPGAAAAVDAEGGETPRRGGKGVDDREVERAETPPGPAR